MFVVFKCRAGLPVDSNVCHDSRDCFGQISKTQNDVQSKLLANAEDFRGPCGFACHIDMVEGLGFRLHGNSIPDGERGSTIMSNKRRQILLCAVGFALWGIVSVSPEALQGTDHQYLAPRTLDGYPNISGIWRNDTLTPLERPSEFTDREFLTEEEVSQIELRNRKALERDNAPGGRRTGPGWNGAGYNRFWSDRLDNVVHTRRTSMVVDPISGRVPTRYDAEERARWLVANRTMSYKTMSPYSRCITRGLPGSMIPNSYNTGNQIFQVPGHVVILYEMVREPRIIPVDNRPHIGPTIRQWMGDARGYWDGETLVVETTNFTDKGWIAPNQNSRRMHGIPVSRDLKLVERFTRVAEDILEWRVLVEDPRVYTRSWTLELPLRLDMSYTLFEYACHEGNRAITGILGGARHVESQQQ